LFVVCQEKNARQTISLPCVEGKRTANNIFAERFFRRALWKRRTANILFAVRPKENTRQRFSRTANSGFPVVSTDLPVVSTGNLSGGKIPPKFL
jgi:hypothetical protein